MASIHMTYIVDQYQNYTTCSKPNVSLRITEPKEFRLFRFWAEILTSVFQNFDARGYFVY